MMMKLFARTVMVVLSCLTCLLAHAAVVRCNYIFSDCCKLAIVAAYLLI